MRRRYPAGGMCDIFLSTLQSNSSVPGVPRRRMGGKANPVLAEPMPKPVSPSPKGHEAISRGPGPRCRVDGRIGSGGLKPGPLLPIIGTTSPWGRLSGCAGGSGNR